MKIEHIAPAQLNPAVYNPRQLSEHDKNHLKESLLRFGFVDPIAVNKHPERQNIVVGGHQRLAIAIELGM